jgi:hypothetical protein
MQGVSDVRAVQRDDHEVALTLDLQVFGHNIP